MPFLGQPLIVRLLDRLKPLADELLITTNRPEAFAFLNLPLAPDILPGRGALGGLYTALHAAKGHQVAVVACDMPFINPVLLAAQRDLLLAAGADVVIPRSPHGLEPLHAVYRRQNCLPALSEALESGQQRVISWFPSVKVREMTPEEIAPYDPDFYAFRNVNTPKSFLQAEQLALALQQVEQKDQKTSGPASLQDEG